jgi:nicotinamidase-related amidase
MLKPTTTGLILVDVQGKLARLVDNSETVISNIQKLVQGCQALNLPILWLEQNPGKLGSTVAEIGNLIKPQPAIAKYTFNACQEPSFVKAVQVANVDTWLVCGIEAHICVYQTVMGLQDLGQKVHLVTDCISSRKPENKHLAIAKLTAQGIDMTSLEMCLYELVEDCRAAEFKTILQLIK